MNTTPQQSATPTPRTDAEAYDSRDGRRLPEGNVVSVYFARQLETELTAAKDAERIAQAEVEPYKKLNLELADLLKAERAQLATKEQELAEAKAESLAALHERQDVQHLLNEADIINDTIEHGVRQLVQQLAARDATIAGLRAELGKARAWEPQLNPIHVQVPPPKQALAQAPKAQPPTPVGGADDCSLEEMERADIADRPFEVWHEEGEGRPPTFMTWVGAMAAAKKWNRECPGHIVRPRNQPKPDAGQATGEAQFSARDGGAT